MEHQKTATHIDPMMQVALISALPILASCLDDATKARIKAAVEARELGSVQAGGLNNPLIKQSNEALRLLLNVK
ncbi:hypothetical protein KWI12_19785 [Citrobacter cronae]|uniref:hypothetical protein n=1 Tax=Citrobacter cronae TaxID=1748967 RepID=UPI0021CE90CE|nr:hypothetical protein [Citrobacter cronae]MCU6199100.1 hypothetical protein [Citrobacter cronae]